MASASNVEILVPVDFSAASELALDWAARYAAAVNARVHVIHVLKLLPSSVVPEPVAPNFPGPDDEAGLKKLLLETATRHSILPSSARVNVAAHIGEEILSVAKALGASLIVMGTHGRGGVARWVLGSVAEHVVRRAECPVVTVRMPDDAASAKSP